ncbi:GNAT family N-acetyltransferase [Mycolicibacterium elephantis]|uniref:GNAT family N-acetyltransferase n=1 Tax=Mycolicibacterium elephantis TaxID=81858 RepID=UPI000AA7A8AF|nr:GNAT family N-acetyltransferase [Mycolicibacterium elephantis]
MNVSWRIEALSGPDAAAVVEPLFREYLDWILARFAADLGAESVDPDGTAERAYFAETQRFLGPGGRLLVARRDDEIVGVGAFKPTYDERTAEIKRMFVRPSARGSGIARALLDRLLNAARSEGYTMVRLETMSFMTEAHALYQSVGARAIDPFDGSEAGNVGLAGATTYLELPL